MNYESLRKYKVGIYIKFRHMLRGKIFERNEEIGIGGQICPLPVCLGLNICKSINKPLQFACPYHILSYVAKPLDHHFIGE